MCRRCADDVTVPREGMGAMMVKTVENLKNYDFYFGCHLYISSTILFLWIEVHFELVQNHMAITLQSHILLIKTINKL